MSWFMGDALGEGEAGLELDGEPLARLARDHGTPFYAYGRRTLDRRIDLLHSAFPGIRLHYAMKANRFVVPTLHALSEGGRRLGIDACSPREAGLALECGFRPEQISVTAGMLSDRDLALLRDFHLNLDTRSALRRRAASDPASPAVGLRLDPGVKVGWGGDPKLGYGASKFGFSFDEAEDAARFAAGLGLEVDTLHVHAGWNLPEDAAPHLAVVFARLAELSRLIPSVRTINVGGGLGVRQREEDRPLSVEAWAGLLREHLAPTGCAIAAEPGTFLVAPAGVLVVEINTVERRRGGTWVGVDAGHAVNLYAAHYGIPHAIIPVKAPTALPRQRVHLAGNINEANDVFAWDLPLPEVEEGDLLAFFPAGAYGSSMASDHCLRGQPGEVVV